MQFSYKCLKVFLLPIFLLNIISACNKNFDTDINNRPTTQLFHIDDKFVFNLNNIDEIYLSDQPDASKLLLFSIKPDFYDDYRFFVKRNIGKYAIGYFDDKIVSEEFVIDNSILVDELSITSPYTSNHENIEKLYKIIYENVRHGPFLNFASIRSVVNITPYSVKKVSRIIPIVGLHANICITIDTNLLRYPINGDELKNEKIYIRYNQHFLKAISHPSCSGKNKIAFFAPPDEVANIIKYNLSW